MTSDVENTADLLRRWNGGDKGALDDILRQNLSWIENRVRKRLGPKLRRKHETVDIVQQSMVEFLRYGPRFEIASEGQFRALVGKIVENTIRDQNDWFNARRRAVSREQPLPQDSIVNIGHSGAVTRPEDAAHKNEMEAWIRLALELLDPEDRRVIVLRQWEGLSFQKVGEAMQLSGEAARKRFARALPLLAAQVDKLRRGEIEESAEE